MQTTNNQILFLFIDVQHLIIILFMFKEFKLRNLINIVLIMQKLFTTFMKTRRV